MQPDHEWLLDDGNIGLRLLTLPVGTTRETARLIARQQLSAWLAARFNLSTHFPLNAVHPVLPGSDLHFSLSYARDRVLIGWCRGKKLGVDLVASDDLPADLAEREVLARLYFPPDWQSCAAAPADFAQAWARLEACCKALSLPLSEIDLARQHAYKKCQLFNFKGFFVFSVAMAAVSVQTASLPRNGTWPPTADAGSIRPEDSRPPEPDRSRGAEARPARGRRVPR